MGMIAGTFIGAAAVTALHAQTKSPVYLVSEITVTNADAYGKEYSPKVQPTIKAHGGRIIALGGTGGGGAGTVTSLQGDPPPRVAIQQWESMEALQKWWDSADYKAARAIGDKYAKFRIYTVTGANLQ
ncbi:MAG TPA: DUF1330 domain-containing protein [Steroidobacteraceae bacterium]|jgi:uncharacterized protein (DUF1330 family)